MTGQPQSRKSDSTSGGELIMSGSFLLWGREFLKFNLPDSPGVYFFKSGTEILYIGRATSLRDRVRSYFGSNILETRSALIADMVRKADNIDYITTESVLEAIILEAKLIKENQPPANVEEKDDKSFNHVVITKERFPQIFTVRGKDLKTEGERKPYKYIFGPFPNGGALLEALKFIRRIFPYRDKKCIPCEIQQKNGKPCRSCFNRHIGLCPGVCTGEISSKDYGRIIQNIRLLFEGRKKAVLAALERDMTAAAKAEEFEKAVNIRKQIFALTHIRDVAMIKNGAHPNGVGPSRIVAAGIEEGRVEAYDIAHLGGTNTRGVMVVLRDGNLDKSQYRLFKLRRSAPGDDTGALKEVLARRLAHPEWPYPEIIVIDGGRAQLNAASNVLKQKVTNIKLISVLKDERHKAREILGELDGITKENVIKINAEAHRFVIGRYRRASRKAWL